MTGTRARRAEFQMSSSHEHPPGLGQLSGWPFSGTFQDGMKDTEYPEILGFFYFEIRPVGNDFDSIRA